MSFGGINTPVCFVQVSGKKDLQTLYAVEIYDGFTRTLAASTSQQETKWGKSQKSRIQMVLSHYY